MYIYGWFNIIKVHAPVRIFISSLAANYWNLYKFPQSQFSNRSAAAEGEDLKIFPKLSLLNSGFLTPKWHMDSWFNLIKVHAHVRILIGLKQV